MASPSSNGRLWSLPQLAKEWGWSLRKLRGLVHAHAIPHLRERGRIYFEEAAIEAWKAARRDDRSYRHHAATPQATGSVDEECARFGITRDDAFL